MECYCGCGRKVGIGSRRGMNKNVHRTATLMQELESTRTVVKGEDEQAGGDPSPLIALLDGWIDEGEGHRAFWIDAVHGDHPRTAGAALEAKREWNAWAKNALQITTLFKRPPEKRQAIIQSWP